MNQKQKGKIRDGAVIMDHGASWCFGTSLAPTSPDIISFSHSPSNPVTWFNVLDVRQFGTMPFRLSFCAQGLIRIAPVIIRVPDRFRRRFRPFTFNIKTRLHQRPDGGAGYSAILAKGRTCAMERIHLPDSFSNESTFRKMSSGFRTLSIGCQWSAADSLHHLDLARSPALVEERRERAVEAQDRAPAFLRIGLDPIAPFDAGRLCRGKVNRRRSVGVRLGGG